MRITFQKYQRDSFTHLERRALVDWLAQAETRGELIIDGRSQAGRMLGGRIANRAQQAIGGTLRTRYKGAVQNALISLLKKSLAEREKWMKGLRQ